MRPRQIRRVGTLADAAEEGKAKTLLLEWIEKARASDVAQLETMTKTTSDKAFPLRRGAL